MRKLTHFVKPKLSRGPDNIPAYFLKMVMPSIALPLSLLFDWSFTTSTVPSQFKTSIVVPIYKRKGKKSDVSAYRPISLYSSIVKLQEKVLIRALLSHCRIHRLISDYQFGFLPKRCLTSQLLLCLKDWTGYLSRKEPCYVVYIDFRRAFDTVSHAKLLSKLRSFGLSGSLLGWVEQYLSGRTQVVSISGATSESAPVTSGIGQGSCSGPIFYLMYGDCLISSLSEICSVTAYADDVKLYSNDPAVIQRALTLVSNWCKTWQLSLSIDKCCVLALGNTPQVPFLLESHVLPYVSSMKDLGILVDSDLSFSEHVTYLVKKARSKCGVILKCFSSGKVALLKKAYITYIRPQLESSPQVWNSISLKDSKRLESVQRFFTQRLFLKCGMSKNTSYERRLKFLGLETLAFRRYRSDMTLCFKIYHNLTHCPNLLNRKPQ